MKVCNQLKWIETVDQKYLNRFKPTVLGPRHNPIKHSEVLGFFKQRLEKNNIQMSKEKGLLSQDKLKYIYVTDVCSEDLDDMVFSLGFINYNNKQKAFTGITGEKVFVCSNEMFIGETIENKRHTKNIGERLVLKIDQIINTFKHFRDKRLVEIKDFKEFEFSEDHIGHIILNLLREKTISNVNIKRILSEWDSPKYNDFKDRNAWSFQNCATEVFKNIKNPITKFESNRVLLSSIKKEVYK